jgi:CRISPR-associated protein Cse2 (CRISPR_cse2)
MTTDMTQDAVAAILRWWKALKPGDNGHDGDRAGRAQLRRAETLMDALALAQTQALLQAVRKNGLSEHCDDAVIMLAMLLAHVTGERTNAKFAQVLGQTHEGQRPKQGEGGQRLSRLRFGALMQALGGSDKGAQIRSLRRTMMILKNTNFDVRQFAGDILHLNEKTRRDWTYQYWQTWRDPEADAAISSPETTS